jgi:hypothetical protein
MEGLALPWGEKAQISVENRQEHKRKYYTGADLAAGKRIEV